VAVIGEPAPGSVLNVRLYKAALEAFRNLAEYGFRPVDTDLDSYRGGTVSFTDGLRLVTISADWIEGVIDVRVREAGGPARSLEAIVPDAVASSLRLSRISRAPTKGMLTSRLVEVTRVLRLHLDSGP
jgi:hypothetical protein